MRPRTLWGWVDAWMAIVRAHLGKGVESITARNTDTRLRRPSLANPTLSVWLAFPATARRFVSFGDLPNGTSRRPGR
jgi:hypothetical protein